MWRTLLSAAALVALPEASSGAMPCRIEVVDRENGWPVPLVELRTTHEARLVTDNAGLIAFDLPELMGRETYFTVIGHGYGVPADGFGFRGVRLTPKEGGTLRVEVDRQLPAKRLGRLTGAGIFAESRKLGERLEWGESGVMGSDSVQNAIYGGKMYWAWGDTKVAHYPLGVFDTTSAVTPLDVLRDAKPPIALTFDYFRDADRRVKGVAKMPGPGPTWIIGYTTLADGAGGEHLVGSYTKIENHLDTYEIGLCVWDAATEAFEQSRVLWKKSDGGAVPPWPNGHPSTSTDGEWLYFGDPFPTLRMPATYEAWQDPATWEPLDPQSEVPVADGESIEPHRGSIAWNPWRKRWVAVFTQEFGAPSAFGELWYAEADAPTGPWGTAVKVVTHENYTFYNPRLHPEFSDPESPVLLFEATYTAEFANHARPTPRYDYNQILYRLDLDDPSLAPSGTD